jgi:hypothetical protein
MPFIHPFELIEIPLPVIEKSLKVISLPKLTTPSIRTAFAFGSAVERLAQDDNNDSRAPRAIIRQSISMAWFSFS